MKPVKIAIIIYLIVIACILTMGYGIAHAAYDSFKLQCGTLTGEGYIMVYVNDETYHIPLVCK